MTLNRPSLQLLMVEAVADDAALLVSTLERGGYAISPSRVETAEALRAALETQPWDLMTCAHHLPRFDAPAAVTLAHELCPDLPVIVVSKDSSQSLAVEVMRCGASDYVRKDDLPALPLAVERELRAVEAQRQRRQAEAALRESEERWQYALEGAEEGVWDVNLQTGEAFRSRRWKALLGYADEELPITMAEVMALVHPDDRDRVVAADEAFHSGQSPTFHLEYRVRCKDGSYRWTLDRGKVISYTPEGQPLRAIGTQTDITERKQAEAELRNLMDFSAGIIRSMAEGITVEDPEGRVTFANPAACRILGRTPEELLGQTWRVYIPADLHAEMSALDERRRAGIQDRYEAEVIRPDGQRVPVLVSGSPRFENGEYVGTLGVFTDLSESRQAAEQLRELETRFNSLVKNAPWGVHLCQQAADGRMVLIAANAAADAILGLSHAELIGKPLEEALAGFKGPDLARHYREVVERGTFWEAEHMDYVDGRVASAYSMQAIRMGVGRTLGVFINNLENKRAQETIHTQAEELQSQIQELRQQNQELLAQGEAFHRVEQELRASEQKYRALIDLTDTGYVILDTAGRVVEANEEFLRFTGRAEMDEILGHSVIEWTALHDLELNQRELEACLEEGFVRDLEIDYVDPAGQITHIAIDATTLSTDEGVFIVALCRDVNARQPGGAPVENGGDYGEDYAAL